VPIVKLVSGMLDDSHKGKIVLLVRHFSMLGSIYAIESLQETRRRVHNLLKCLGLGLRNFGEVQDRIC
jgi:hypothetical protein